MLISKINNCKPKPHVTFLGNESGGSGAKVRYKHYREVPDEILCAKSIINAHESIKKSGKMRLLKAVPAISAGIITTGLMIAQPGKTSSKLATGLGFLAFWEAFTMLKSAFTKDNKSESSATLKSAAALTLGTIGFAAVKKGISGKSVDTFISSQSKALSSAINQTSAAKFLDKNINKIANNHPKLANLGFFSSLALALGVDVTATNKLTKDIREDIRQKSCENFAKSKLIQQMAKEYYDSIDAEEI